MKKWFYLREAKDLYRKLKWEYNLLLQAEDRMTYAYRAWNFFVTADHLMDWLFPGEKDDNTKSREQLRKSNINLQLCWDLANGAKHFETKQYHTAAENTGAMFVTFTVGNEKKEGKGNLDIVGPEGYIEATDLAQKVMEYWDEYFTTSL